MPLQMKPILDACCGGRMFYFDKEDPRVLYQDIRDEEIELTKGGLFKVHPDVVADFRNMPYPDNTFRMVVFDPPHMVYYSRNNASHERRGDLYAEYGELKKDWRDYLKRGFAECFRVLQPGGFLIFKWSDTDIKVKNILALTQERPVFGHKSGKSANTHWICFMKEERLPSLSLKELKLVLTYKWYDMIESGEKPEEYRDLTEFYRSRIEDRSYDIVTFYRGYAKGRKTMSYKYGGYRVGTGQEKWGAVPGKQYYVIKMGERL